MNKKKLKTEETRQKIVDAALHLFARQGYHKTTVQDIANHICMTSGALFHHFSSKKEILYKVIEKLNAGMDRYIDYLSLTRQGSRETVTGLVDLFVEKFHSDPDEIIALASFATEFGSVDDPVVERIHCPYNRFIRAMEEKCDFLPETVNKRAFAVSFFSGIQGIFIQAIFREGQMGIDELAQGFVDMVTTGL
ncbi:MAG: TetR/AcrR family transcriptional regulator [Desulfobacteraceae bacterium]